MMKHSTMRKPKNKDNGRPFYLRHLVNEEGIAIVMALLFLVLLALLAPVAMQNSAVDTATTGDFR